ncbi:unnamed protein product [Colias eurytheme]|nr:unnamed protein product [Colias eurytheme]
MKQKQQRVDASNNFLGACGDEPVQILDRIVTGDETWAHHFHMNLNQNRSPCNGSKRVHHLPRNSKCQNRQES